MNANQLSATVPVVQRLLEQLPSNPQGEKGNYQVDNQTWSHRNAVVMSPVKHQREN